MVLVTRGPLTGDLRELPRAFWVLFTGTFINRFGTFVMPFPAIYLTRQGYTISGAGIAISAHGTGALLASLIGGHPADTIGRRHTMLLGSWSAAGSPVALYYAAGLSAMMAVAALNGFANALYSPAASALIAGIVRDYAGLCPPDQFGLLTDILSMPDRASGIGNFTWQLFPLLSSSETPRPLSREGGVAAILRRFPSSALGP